MGTVFWTDGGPPSVPRLDVKVFSCPANGTHYVRFLGDPLGVWLHWTGGRTVPCAGVDCVHCLANVAQRWKAYGPAQVWRQSFNDQGAEVRAWEKVVAELTYEAYLQLSGQAWRGLVVELKRESKRSNSRLIATVADGKLKSDEPLVEPFDVKPILLNLWAVRARVIPSRKGPSGPLDGTGGQQAEKIPATIPFNPAAAQAYRKGG